MSEARDRLKDRVALLRALVRKAKSASSPTESPSGSGETEAKKGQPTNPRRKRNGAG